jgi:hypothetical protein
LDVPGAAKVKICVALLAVCAALLAADLIETTLRYYALEHRIQYAEPADPPGW